jgi:pimeloyl-ACP methyl ester carboxylesterase
MEESIMKDYFRTSDDAVIYYEDYGSGRPIVLIPGFVCSTRFFERNVEGLSKNNRLVIMDPRGHGNSSKSLEGHTLKAYARDIKELLDHLNLKDAFLLAWSMSGQTILKYFQSYKNHRISALGLIDSPLGAMYPEEWNAHGLKNYNMDLYNKFLKMSYNDYEGYCKAFAKKIWGGVDESALDWSLEEFLKTPAWISFAIYSDMVFQNGYEMLPQVEVPMLFMGADSAVTANGKALATKYYPEKLNPKVYKESYTFEKGGHVFFYINPDEFNSVVLKFLSKI